MSFKTTHQSGDPIKAEDANDTGKAILQNAANILQLFLENFFASKVTPFQGLLFDGFSDTTKANTTATTNSAQAASGQADVVVVSVSGFAVNDQVLIADGSNFEELIIQGIAGSTLTMTTNLVNTYEIGATVGRTTANINTIDKKLEFASTGSFALFDDQFNRGDSNTVGNGWTEFGNADADTAIVGNALRMRTTNSVQTDGIRRNLGAGLGAALSVHLSFKQVQLTVASTIYIMYFGNDDTSDGPGTQLRINPQSADYKLRDGGDKATVAQAFSVGVTHFFFIDFLPASGGQIQVKVFRDTVDVKPASPEIDVTFTPDNPNGTFTKIIMGGNANNESDTNFITYTQTTKKAENYYTKLNSFQKPINLVRLWVTRNFPSKFNLASGISAGATTLTITGDKTSEFANGDTIDISTSDNITRERKLLTATPTFGGGVTTLTFSATTNAFTTSAFVERVDVLPEISAVSSGVAESFSSPIFVSSIVDFSNSEVEDEYTLAPSAKVDVIAKLALRRNTLSVAPVAKRLGVVTYQ